MVMLKTGGIGKSTWLHMVAAHTHTHTQSCYSTFWHSRHYTTSNVWTHLSFSHRWELPSGRRAWCTCSREIRLQRVNELSVAVKHSKNTPRDECDLQMKHLWMGW